MPDAAVQWLRSAWESFAAELSGPDFYSQLGIIAVAVVLAMVISAALLRARAFQGPPTEETRQPIRAFLYRTRRLVLPLVIVSLLGMALPAGEAAGLGVRLVRLAQGVAILVLLFLAISDLIREGLIKHFVVWIGIPIAALHVFGWLDAVSAYLDSIAFSLGNIHISLLALTRTLIFGTVLFWLGRVSNNAGKQVIRNQPKLDASTREIFAKLFEISLFVVIFLLLLQIMGISLTALAVFGGAVGIGLGFGLQQIASNFISGIIILLDRSVTIGDFVELEDGRSGVLRELNMRYGILESFDGKDYMVPNETFITSSYTNWTHKDPRQRYSLEFQVAYSTDLDLLFDNIRAICAAHPMVLSGDDLPVELRPDAEIAGFGDSGIDILVEFWMEGIDDGKNRVGADLLHAIWRSIKEHGMEIPFPQREVRILGDSRSPLEPPQR